MSSYPPPPPKKKISVIPTTCITVLGISYEHMVTKNILLINQSCQKDNIARQLVRLWQPYVNSNNKEPVRFKSHSQGQIFFLKSRSTCKVKVTRSKIKVYSAQSLITANTIPLLVQKIWPGLNFFISRSNFKVKVTGLNILISVKRSCHKECTCEIGNPYTSSDSEDMAKVNFF